MRARLVFAILFFASLQQARADMLVDGDMYIMTPKGQSKDAAFLSRAELWEDGVLPLTFNGFSADKQQQLLAACSQWSRVANVRCVLGSYKGRTVQVYHVLDACFSLWGMGNSLIVVGRIMNLADGCFYNPTLLHELGHAFGFIHEHQRPDRDQYITINRDNVDGKFLDFNTRVNFDPQQMKMETPYDFLSIMHYDRKAFSKNGEDTIVPLPRYSGYIDIMGNVPGISALDALALEHAYGPPLHGAWTPPVTR